MTPRESIKVLVEKCPVNTAPLPTCALGSIRALDCARRDQRIADLTDQEVETLVRQHLLCVCVKNGCSV